MVLACVFTKVLHMVRVIKIVFCNFTFICFLFELQAQAFTMEDCMRYALAHAPEKNIQDIENANTALSQRDAVLAFLPSIQAGVGASVNFGRSIDPETNIYTTVANFNNSYSLWGSLSVFDGFSAINNLKIARLSILMGHEESNRIRDAILLQTMQAYFNVIYYVRILSLAKEQLLQDERSFHQAKVQEELGLKGYADVMQAEAQQASGYLRCQRAENQLRTALLTLKQTMYYPLEDTLQIDTSFCRWSVALPSEEESLESVKERAFSFLPTVKISSYTVQTSVLNLRTSRGNMFPTLSVSGGYSTGYSTIIGAHRGSSIAAFPEQFRNRAGQYFSVQLSLPVFNRLWGYSQLRRSKNNLNIARLRHEQTLREIEGEIERAVEDMQGAVKEYFHAEKQVRAEEVAYAANERRYAEGLISILDLQISSNRLLEAKTERLNSLFQYLLKRKIVNYYRGISYLEEE